MSDHSAYLGRDKDFFLTDTLLCAVRMDWWVYLRAVEHFFGQSLEAGKIIAAKPQQGPRQDHNLTEDEEYVLLWSLFANQHEHCHFYQFMSTATGIYTFFLDAWYWDFMKEFAGRLYRYVRTREPTAKPTLPLSKYAGTVMKNHGEVPEDLEFGAHICSIYELQMQLFDNREMTKGDAVQIWNAVADFEDGKYKQPGDTITLSRLADPSDPDELANPSPITFRSLIESSARCEDLANLKTFGVSTKLLSRFISEACTGEYVTLIDLVSNSVESSDVCRLVSKMAGIALQAPLTSLHLPNGGGQFQWDDINPTQRFAKLLNHVSSRSISAKALIHDPDAPDRICEQLGWPTVSSLLDHFLHEPHFAGVNPTVGFVLDRHRSFCEYSLFDQEKPVWMLDVLWSSQPKAQEFAAAFYPPWQFAGGELVLHATCDPTVTVGTWLGLLTTVAAREMHESDRLNDTHEILNAIETSFVKRGHSDFVQVLQEQWEETFEQTFGFSTSDIEYERPGERMP